MSTKNVQLNSVYAWVLAARPKTLTAALIPVMVGSSLAFSEGKAQAIVILICALFAALMQIAANFINDLFDFLKGSDREDRLGPERVCAQGLITPRVMKRGILITLTIACAVGSLLLFYGGWPLIAVGVFCVIFAFLYTTGPYPLSYHGWGDLLVLIFFGFVAVGVTCYVQMLTWTIEVTVASLICGLVIDTLLVVNNYRDREADRRSGKRTVVVRFGEPFGRNLYFALGLIAAALCLWFAFEGKLLAALLPQLYLPFHFLTWKKMIIIHEGKPLNSILAETSRNMFLMGFLLSLGLLLNA
jgi:1,4-dihydroxy-2-naphthoate octaprenyltransferase